MSIRCGSVGSSGSNGSRCSTNYRTKAKRSEVDELLFGLSTKNSALFKTTPETVQVITKDLIRNVVVPSKDCRKALLLNKQQFRNIKSKSKVKSPEGVSAEIDSARQEQEKELAAATKRKERFQMMDLDRKQNATLNELELEAKELNEHLLEKAKAKRLEQEDEIKHLNELITNAKCHVIRDAQILEKEEIKKDMDDEEKRLDVIMEVHRLNAIKDAEKIESLKAAKRMEGARQIMDQIKSNTEVRILEEEKKNAESAALHRYIEKLQNEDLHDLEQKRELQLQIQKEIEILNNQQQLQKEKRMQEDKMQDMQVKAYIKQKEAREERIKQEKIEIKRLKEEKQMRLLKLQENQQGHQAEQDALRAKQAQEATEREWRRKEREAQLRKEEEDRRMKAARELQIKQKVHFQAVQADRERQVFERIVRNQLKEAQAEKDHDAARHKANIQHAADIRKQIREREHERLEKRRSFFEEAEKKMADEIEHRNKLREVKMRKLEDLRRAGVPEKYAAEVSRRVLDQSQKPLHL